MGFKAALRALQIGLLLCACACTPPEPVFVSRPLEGSSEPITVGDTTRPGVRLDAGGWHVLPLSPLSPGRLELAVAPLGETVTSVEVRLRSRALENDGRFVCAHGFDPGPASGWSDCRIDLTEAIGAPELAVRATSPGGGEVAVASPLHTGLGPVPKGPPIFVIVLDAARADAFRSFNPASPFGDHLAAFAQDGIRFTQARTSSPWTRPAVASLMTGLPPWRHGIIDRRDSLGSRFETLAEKLSEAGYATHAYVTNPNLLPVFGFDQGFDVFEDLGSVAWKSAKVDAAPVFERTRAGIDSASARPEFHWIHLMDPHTPYEAPKGALGVAYGLGKKHGLSPGRLPYNAEIVDVDRKLGAFFDDLRAAELYDRSLIMVVSDHGEAFREHGVSGHGKQLFEESIRIAAIVKLPGGAHAGSVSELELGLEDMHGIVLDAALGEVAAGGLEWLANLQAGPQIAVLALADHRKSAITEAGWKLIVDHASGEQTLFNLAVDPLEVADVSAANPDRVRSMRLQLNTERSRGAAGLHLRWCGGPRASSVQMTVNLGERDVHQIELESTDTIEGPEAGRLHLSFELTPQPNPLKEAFLKIGDQTSLRKQGRTFADQDEIRLTHPDGEPAEPRAGVRLQVDSPASWDVRFGESTVTQPRGRKTIDLSDHALELLVSPGDPVACSVMPKRRPLLHIWYIADPNQIDPDALSPEAIERLRALGYQW